jgi:hypothetical protein
MRTLLAHRAALQPSICRMARYSPLVPFGSPQAKATPREYDSDEPIPKVGVVVVICAAILGQMIGSFLTDTFGWFGLNKVPVDPVRLLGIALLISGVLLVQRK